MNTVESRVVGDGEGETRLDRWLRRLYPGLTQGRVEKMLRTGQIRVDGRRIKSSHRLSPGEVVRLPPFEPGDADKSATRRRVSSHRADDGDDGKRAADADRIKAMTLYKDDAVLVLNKPAGLAVQGGTSVSRSVDGMLDAVAEEGAEGGGRPRLVHRLDRDTAGVLVLARTPEAARRLTAAFRGRSVRKIYWGLVRGIPEPADGVIDAPLNKSGGSREKMEIDESDGRRAITLFRTLDRAGKVVAWLALWPRTGRTHQIRAHCAAIGTPILGDGKYGGREAFVDSEGLARKVHLLARRIVLPHPGGRGMIDVTAPLPDHMTAAFDVFGLNPRDAPADPFPDET